MFKIRQDVMQTYRDQRIGLSLAKLAEELRAKLPDLVKTFSDSKLKQFCDQGATKAARYGLTTEYNVYRFLAAQLLFGPDFDTDPTLKWTQDFLFDPLIDEDHKSRLLELRIAIDKDRSV